MVGMTPLPGGPQAYGYMPDDITLDTELGPRAYLQCWLADQHAQFAHAVMKWRSRRRAR